MGRKFQQLAEHGYPYVIDEPTVFILGAGANKPYDFPLGEELAELIYNWSETGEFRSELQRLHPAEGIGRIRRMACDIIDSGWTVDRWLAQNRENCDGARYCIARFVALKENPEVLRRGWYDVLWRRLLPEEHSDTKPTVLLKSDVTFVTFNYDRSLEQALLTRAQASFQRNSKDCSEIVSQLRIFHVHGQLGRLPWQKPVGRLAELPERPYAPKFDSGELVSCAGIKIVSETNRDTKEYIEARKYLARAERIHFLGFGYDEENLSRLKFGFGSAMEGRITGTHRGISGPRKERLERDGGALQMPITLRGMPEDVDGYSRTEI